MSGVLVDRAARPGAARGATGLPALSLGIVPAHAPLPRGMHRAAGAPDLDLVVVPGDAFASPRARMAGCVAVQAMSPAFLPWPPRRPVAPRTARERARRCALSLQGMLAMAQDHVELALLLPVTPPPRCRHDSPAPGAVSFPPEGRTWLAARAGARAAAGSAQSAARSWLYALVERLAAEATSIESTATGLRVSVCMRRAPEGALADQAARAASALGAPPTGSGRLLVTGPWPLFSFAQGCPG
ncbi:hypothetical protein DLJ49_08775 [Rhodovulum sp. 12E13]|uniref:hypothetical protein n=1 Tax=Rhodovulum sp. 12E13 TaxID=2203891 RepID=UPI000E1498A9|nr:hypothetical protein [Rhodovulum sp. 12E13]RDC73189.1 hypothetical protein DLJ49_08775 [Rhodovulum sp. 12E13]